MQSLRLQLGKPKLHNSTRPNVDRIGILDAERGLALDNNGIEECAAVCIGVVQSRSLESREWQELPLTIVIYKIIPLIIFVSGSTLVLNLNVVFPPMQHTQES